MFHCTRGRDLLILILVLGSWLLLVSCDDSETDIEAMSDAAPESAQVVTSVEADGDLSLDECVNPSNSTKEICCKSPGDIDKTLLKCYVLHQKKLPKDESNNPALIKFLSCLVECFYKGKKFIGKGNTLNMPAIHSNANIMYKDDQRQRDHMIEMYEHCQRYASNQWSEIRDKAVSKVIFKGACKPYFMLVFICVSDYSKTRCPHFKWKGSKENVQLCKDLKQKCEQLHS